MKHRNRHLRNLIACVLVLPMQIGFAHAQSVGISLKNGPLADYGASPWHTDALKLGVSDMDFIFDTGTNLLWATTDDCTSVACSAHKRVSTSQVAFSFIPNPDYPKSVSFGPWGSMEVDLATVPVSITTDGSPVSFDIEFEASLNYSGSKFQYLNWGGGIGLPSESSSIQANISDFFLTLHNQQNLAQPIVSFEMNRQSGLGSVTFGAFGPYADQGTFVSLDPKKSTSPGLSYLWGTNLAGAELGEVPLPNLTNSIFYLDTGSSRFKGGRQYVEPILDVLLQIKDPSGAPVFEPFSDDPNSTFTGIKYANGKSPADYPGLLPNFDFMIGSNCKMTANTQARFTLSPTNYSYLVEQGDRAGEWVIAFHVLDGVDGLLVGSTFLDGFSTTFEYVMGPGAQPTEYSQGEMALFESKDPTAPKTYVNWQCVPA